MNTMIRTGLADPRSSSVKKIFIFIMILTMMTSMLSFNIVNAATDPIGGGAGYSGIISSSSADYIVTDRSEFLAALASAQPGQIIYVDDNSEINLTGLRSLVIPAGVTIASGRGNNGSRGGLIYDNEMYYGTTQFGAVNILFTVGGAGVRITGLRFKGDDGQNRYGTSGNYSFLTGIKSYYSIEMDNNEMYNWSIAAVWLDGSKRAVDASIHHNYIHHNRRDGYGYGVSVSYGANATIDSNIFDWNRHSITADASINTSYTATNNIVYNHGNSQAFLIQRGVISNNTFHTVYDYYDLLSSSAYIYSAVIIRRTTDGAYIQDNTFYYADQARAVEQGDNSNVHVSNNSYLGLEPTPLPPQMSASTSWTGGTYDLGPGHTGFNTAEFDLTVNDSSQESVIGYAGGETAITGQSSCAILIRFGGENNRYFSVFDGSGYKNENQIAVSDGGKFHVRIVPHYDTKTYDVYVTPAGGSEILIANNYAFQTSAPEMTDLGNICMYSGADNSFIIYRHAILNDSMIEVDKAAPTVADGAIASSDVTQTEMTLSWSKATDNTTTQGALQYMVYRSDSNNIDTVANIEANGTAIGEYASDIASKEVAGLTAETVYYFNVIVKDETGNKSCYTMTSFTTLTEPAGGGTGYSRIISSQDADYIVTDRTEFLSALASAQSGQIIYVDDNSEINLTGLHDLVIPAGVTIASGRGDNGSKGGLIYDNEMYYGTTQFGAVNILFTVGGDGVRITGLRLKGDDDQNRYGTSGNYSLITGIKSYYSIEIDNNEMYNWSIAAVWLDGSQRTVDANIHNNYIHHNRRDGYGYGVDLSYGAKATIDSNIFDWNRHSIAGDGRINTSYTATNNIVYTHGNSHAFDMHGGGDRGDGTDVAGETIIISNNTFHTVYDYYDFLNPSLYIYPAVFVRGKPTDGAYIQDNTFYYADQAAAIKQGGGAGNMYVSSNNYLGLEPTPLPPQMSASTSWTGNNLGPGHTGLNTAEFDLTVNDSSQESIIGYAGGETVITGQSSCAMLIGFGGGNNRYFSVFDGSSYRNENQVAVSDGSKFHVRIVPHYYTKTYDVFVTPKGGSEILIANNYAFQTSTPEMSDLGNICTYSSADNSFIIYRHAILNDSVIDYGKWSAKTTFKEGAYLLGDSNTGNITTEFDLTVNDVSKNNAIGYSGYLTTIADLSGCSMIIQFGSGTNYFTVMNGAAYQSGTQVTVQNGGKYHFKIVPDFGAQTYDVYVTPAGGLETLIADDYAISSGTVITDAGRICLNSNANDSFIMGNHYVLKEGLRASRASLQSGTYGLGPDNTGSLTAEFDLIVNDIGKENTIGYAGYSTPITGQPSFAMQIEFGAGTKYFRVRNGDENECDMQVPAVNGGKYHIKVVPDFSAEKYDVYVTPAGGSETLIANDYAFGSNAPAMNDMGKICILSTADFSSIIGDHLILKEGQWASKATWKECAYDLGTGNTGSIYAEFDLMIRDSSANSVIGLAGNSTTINGYGSSSMQIAFAGGDKRLTVRNGGSYQYNSEIKLSDGGKYHFKIIPDFNAKTYDVYVTPEGGTETLIADNYAFRTKAPEMNDLGKISMFSSSNNAFVIGNFILKDVIMDTTPPVTSVKVDGSGENGWYKSDATVTLSSEDSLSGVSQTVYKINGDQDWSVYSGAVTITTEGALTIQYRSTDKAGNVEDTRESTVRIDKTAPSFTLDVNGSILEEGDSFEDCQPLTFSATDNLSGVSLAEITVDNSTYEIDTQSQPSIQIDFAGKIGIHTAFITVQDTAGNRLERSFVFEVKASITSIKSLMDRFIEAGELTGPLIPQLTNSLDQVAKHMDRPDQAIKHMEDFVKHLNNKTKEDNVSDNAKDVLNADADSLIKMWSE